MTSGEITIGGINIKDIESKQLNDLVGFVGQDNFLLNLTFKENIKLGNPEATDEAVEKAAKLAQCHEFIKSYQMDMIRMLVQWEMNCLVVKNNESLLQE